MSGHKAASRAVLHLTLLTCVGIFLFPFVWMVGTSLKTDEELNAPGLFPALPVYRRQSPYVKAEVDPVRPEQVSIERWEELLPALRESALKKVPITEIEHRSSAASVLLNVATQRMGASAWEGSEPQVMHAF